MSVAAFARPRIFSRAEETHAESTAERRERSLRLQATALEYAITSPDDPEKLQLQAQYNAILLEYSDLEYVNPEIVHNDLELFAYNLSRMRPDESDMPIYAEFEGSTPEEIEAIRAQLTDFYSQTKITTFRGAESVDEIRQMMINRGIPSERVNIAIGAYINVIMHTSKLSRQEFIRKYKWVLIPLGLGFAGGLWALVHYLLKSDPPGDIPIVPTRTPTKTPSPTITHTETATLVPTATQSVELNKLILDIQTISNDQIRISENGELVTNWGFNLPDIKVDANGGMAMTKNGYPPIPLSAKDIHIYSDENRIVVSGFTLSESKEEWEIREFPLYPEKSFNLENRKKDGTGYWNMKNNVTLTERDFIDGSLWRYLQTQSIPFDSSKFVNPGVMIHSEGILIGNPNSSPNFTAEGSAPWRLRELAGIFTGQDGHDYLVCPIEFAHPDYPNDPSKNIWIIGLAPLFKVKQIGSGELNWYSIMEEIHKYFNLMNIPALYRGTTYEFDFQSGEDILNAEFGSVEDAIVAFDAFLGQPDADYMFRNIRPQVLDGKTILMRTGNLDELR